MAGGMFRPQAVRSYLDPDSRGGLLRVAPPSLVRLFGVLAVAFVIGVGASLVARVKITARGRGLVRPRTGVLLVQAPHEGYVRVVLVRVGDVVAPGTVLARLDEPVVAPVGGLVDAIAVQPNEHVAAGSPIVKIVPLQEPLVGFLAIPARYRTHLATGQPVRLAIDEYPSSEMGFGAGRIARISEDVITPELALRYLGAVQPSEPSFLVEVELGAVPPRATGRFHNSMPFEGIVVVREQLLATLLVRPLRAFLGE